MRYKDWDVLLFEQSSPVPLQEFRVACYVVQDTGKFIRLMVLGALVDRCRVFESTSPWHSNCHMFRPQPRARYSLQDIHPLVEETNYRPTRRE